MGRQQVSIKGDTEGSYGYVIAHLIATFVLAVAIASVAYGVLFTSSPPGKQTAHSHHSVSGR